MDTKNMLNFYEILGVSEDCTKNDIKKKYRELVKKTHPDKGGKTEIFEMIVTAYETLIDNETRKEYDRLCNILKINSLSHIDLKKQSQEFTKYQIVENENKQENIIEKIKESPDLNIDKTMDNVKLSREQDDIELYQNNPFINGKFDITQFNNIFDDMKTTKNDIIKYNGTPNPWNFEENDIPCQSLDDNYIIDIDTNNNYNYNNNNNVNIDNLLETYKKQTDELLNLSYSEFSNEFYN